MESIFIFQRGWENQQRSTLRSKKCNDKFSMNNTDNAIWMMQQEHKQCNMIEMKDTYTDVDIDK
eukprot:10645441-Ditylum_brightwellii.AAC.1